MIGLLPEIYPDELFYSWMTRTMIRLGYSSYQAFLNEILANGLMGVNRYFLAEPTEEMKQLILSQVDADELVEDHTMFRLLRFGKADKRTLFKDHLAEFQNSKAMNDLKLQHNKNDEAEKQCLKYCPKCAEEQRKKFGEAYWTTTAQLPGLSVCPKHTCDLVSSDIRVSKKASVRLVSAEEVIPLAGKSCNSHEGQQTEIEFGKYLEAVFSHPYSSEDLRLGDRLLFKMVQKGYGFEDNHGVHYSDVLDDLRSFYSECSCLDQGLSKSYEIKRITTGITYNFLFVCQLGYFLGINPDELCEPWEGEAFIKGKTPKRNYANRAGKSSQDWEALDNELVNQVEAICGRLIYDNPPKKIGIHTVERMLDLPDKRLSLLPKCSAIVNGYLEPYPVFWARKMVWAYKELSKAYPSDRIVWRRLRDKVNITKEQAKEALPYADRFADSDVAEAIRLIIPE